MFYKDSEFPIFFAILHTKILIDNRKGFFIFIKNKKDKKNNKQPRQGFLNKQLHKLHKKKNDAAQKKIKKVTHSQDATKLFSIIRILLFSVIYTFEERPYIDDM